jgi:hypothetical protein
MAIKTVAPKMADVVAPLLPDPAPVVGAEGDPPVDDVPGRVKGV